MSVIRDMGSRIFWGDRRRGFLQSNSQWLPGFSPLGRTIADFDGDGDLDVFVANYDQGNKVWLNNGSGNFTDSGQDLRENSSTDNSRGVDLADLDGDGDLDAFVANYSLSLIHI